MAVYTPVSGDELRGFLAHYDVGDLRCFRGIAEGTVNTNFFVETDSAHGVLTLFEQLPAEEIPYFLALMAWLSEHGLPSSHPIADCQGRYLRELNGRPAALFQRLEGVSIERPQTIHCRVVGQALGRLHIAGAGFPEQRENPHGHAWWRSAGRHLIPEVSRGTAVLIREELRFQSLYRLDELPRGPIHGDLFRDNVLFDGKRITGIVDFYFACDDRLLFDLAIAVNDWCGEPDGSLNAERATALLQAYHGERPLTAIERGAWPAMLRAAVLRWWLSRLVEARVPRSGELGRQKDPRELETALRWRIDNHDKLYQLFPG